MNLELKGLTKDETILCFFKFRRLQWLGYAYIANAQRKNTSSIYLLDSYHKKQGKPKEKVEKGSTRLHKKHAYQELEYRCQELS